jgi:peptide/nickel transport system substrate-binding protein
MFSPATRLSPRLALTAATLAAAVILAGCSAGDASSAETTAGAAAADTAATDTTGPVRGGTFTIAFRSDDTSKTTLDPVEQQWLEIRTMLRNVVESLTDQDPATGEIVPWLATGWDISEDQLTYTFSLRQDVTFSNGERFDAAAVKASFDSNLAAIAANPSLFGATYLAGVTGARVIDDFTVEITLESPNAAFLQALSTVTLGILAPDSYAADVSERKLGTNLIGTGPFILETYTPDVSLSLVARDDYVPSTGVAANQGPAYIDRLELVFIPEDSVRVGSLQSGEVDAAAPRNPFSQPDRDLLAAHGIVLESFALPGPIEAYYPKVTEGDPLSDKRVRHAVQSAIDRTTYAATVFGPDYPVAAGVFDSSTPYYKDESDKLTYDPEESKRLLDEAGWVVGDDGYRVKDGEVLELVYPVTAESTGDLLVQDLLRQVGIKLVLNVLTAGEQSEAVSKGEWDFTRGVLTRGDPSILGSILDARMSQNPERSKWSVPADIQTQLQELFTQGLTTLDSPERRAVYEEIQDLLLDEYLLFPVFERVQQLGYQPYVHGIAFTAEGFLDFRSVWLEEH